jgi:hypothetical protein
MWGLGPDADEPEWRVVDDVPFERTLFAVVATAAGPFAIGDGGTTVADRGNGWEVVFDSGPHTRDNQLRALAVPTAASASGSPAPRGRWAATTCGAAGSSTTRCPRR